MQWTRRLPTLVAIAGVLTVAPIAFAGDDDAERFRKACNAGTNMGEVMCACLEKQAKANLSPDGYQFQIATLEKDDARTKELRGKMKMGEIVKAGTFMIQYPKLCAKEGAGK